MNTVIAITSAKAANPADSKPADMSGHDSDFHAALKSAGAHDTATPAHSTARPSTAKATPSTTAQPQADASKAAQSDITGSIPAREGKTDKTRNTKTGKHGADKDAANAANVITGALALPVNAMATLPAAGAALTDATNPSAQLSAKSGGRALHIALASATRAGKDTPAQPASADPLKETAAASLGAGDGKGKAAATTTTNKVKDAGIGISIGEPRASAPRSQHAKLEIAQAVRAATATAASGPATGVTGNTGSNAGNLAAQLQAINAATSTPANDDAARDERSKDPAPGSVLLTSGVSSHAGTAPAASPASPGAPGAALQSSIGTAAWQQELGQQLLRLTRQGNQQIELHLHPAELGPLQISLQMNQQTAQAHFFAAHAVVRDAVQQALPQLREALAGQGIVLGEALVGQQQQPPRDNGHSSRSTQASAVSAVGRASDSAPAARGASEVLRLTPGRGVDLYA